MRNTKVLLGLAVAAGALIGGGTAHAETTFNAGVATDYIFRGIDQTGYYDEGEAFAGVDTVSGSFYAGAWISNTGGNPAQFLEYDLYAGWKPTAGPVSFDLGVIYYGYTDSDASGGESDLSTFELKGATSITAAGATWGAAVYWTPNFSGDYDGLNDNSGLYYELNGAYALANHATISGAFGVVDVEDYTVDSYSTWNLGVSYPVTEHLTIDARYIDTSNDAFAFGFGGDRLIGTLKVSF